MTVGQKDTIRVLVVFAACIAAMVFGISRAIRTNMPKEHGDISPQKVYAGTAEVNEEGLYEKSPYSPKLPDVYWLRLYNVYGFHVVHFSEDENHKPIGVYAETKYKQLWVKPGEPNWNFWKTVYNEERPKNIASNQKMCKSSLLK